MASQRWIRIERSRYLVGLTDDEARQLAEVAAARARARAAIEPDVLHEERELRELDEKWGNAGYLAGLLACSQPAHEVELPAFEISATPVRVADYTKLVREGAVVHPESGGVKRPSSIPAMGVSWKEAHAYAAWCGATLPTEAQWERASRGIDRTLFPWGNEWGAQGQRLDDDDQFVPVGSRPDRGTPDGIHDLVTFGYEWCADEFRPYPGEHESTCGPPPVGGWPGTRARRGGPVTGFPPSAATRKGVGETLRLRDTTFRLVRAVAP